LTFDIARAAPTLGLRFEWVSADGGDGKEPGFQRAPDDTRKVFVADFHCNQWFWSACPARAVPESKAGKGRAPTAAKARGVTFGRPKKMRLDQQELARELVRDGKSISAVARTFNVHPATIHRVIAG
jgi:hypothetical protein